MERSWRNRALYGVLLPAIAVAASILGYYSWQTASQFARLGEQTIAQSTLLIVQEKVAEIEERIIAIDNGVFSFVDLTNPEAFTRDWRRVARDQFPTVRAALMLGEDTEVLAFSSRLSRADQRRFLRDFRESILGELELGDLRAGRLRHWHGNVGERNYLVSYQAYRRQGQTYFAVCYHDTGYIRREEFPALFESDEGIHIYNVIDDNNDRVFGPNLARAGDYLVGLRFPTTLYTWRLQIAPRQAPQLEAQGRTRAINEVILIGTAFLIILLGVGFLIYAASKERRLNALKSVFIANVSHELKTPLSVIRMFGELLLTRRVRDDEKRREYLAIICRESERLTTLIENVLDFSALERGKRNYDLQNGDLETVIRRAIDTFRYRAEREGTEIEFEAAAEVPQVAMDEQAIVLAVINLLDNAAKYGEGSKVEVSVEAGNEEAVVRVRDHGPGIPEAHLRRVFERFYRGQEQRGTRGSGIGLSMVHQIAVAHRGVAWASNHPEGGAVVSFAIPASAPETLDSHDSD